MPRYALVSPPTSPQLRWNKEIAPNLQIPKYTVDLVVDQVSLGLDDSQYQNLIKVLAFFITERRVKKETHRELKEEPQGPTFLCPHPSASFVSPHLYFSSFLRIRVIQTLFKT